MNKSCHAELVSASHDKDPKKEKNKAPLLLKEGKARAAGQGWF
tara:strand:- start:34526 stop:34654 length:129 start_codon:yes stop_codon:yes gene_type:complete